MKIGVIIMNLLLVNRGSISCFVIIFFIQLMAAGTVYGDQGIFEGQTKIGKTKFLGS